MLTNQNILQQVTYYTDLGEFLFQEVRLEDRRIVTRVTHIKDRNNRKNDVVLTAGVDTTARNYLNNILETTQTLGKYKKPRFAAWVNRF